MSSQYPDLIVAYLGAGPVVGPTPPACWQGGMQVALAGLAGIGTGVCAKDGGGVTCNTTPGLQMIRFRDFVDIRTLSTTHSRGANNDLCWGRGVEYRWRCGNGLRGLVVAACIVTLANYE